MTQTAQESSQYQDYLSREGEDNNTYYSVKIQAAKLLLEHEGDTFVTPVFNGSASLRDAAGQLIEEVTKSVRRGETVDDAYMENLYSDITSLYHLDEYGALSQGRAGSGPSSPYCPGAPGALGGVWILILLLAGLVKIEKTEQLTCGFFRL